MFLTPKAVSIKA